MKQLQFGTFPELEMHERIQAREDCQIKQIRWYTEDASLQKRKARTRKSIFDVK